MAAVNFFASTVDSGTVDECISAFNNMSYDITHKQRTKWNKQSSKGVCGQTKSKKGSRVAIDKPKDRFIPIRDEQ